MRYLGKFSKLSWNATSDFRAKATFGVACAALLLLLPVAFLDFYEGHIAIGIGSLGIVSMLAAAAWMVSQNQCPQKLTLFGLVPAGMVFMISVFDRDGIIGTLWCYPSIIACYCMLSERRAWMANVAILAISMPMVWLTLDIHYTLRIYATLAAISVFSAILVRVIDEQRRQLQIQLIRDPLTGLLNRVSLQLELERAVTAHVVDNRQSSLMAIDIDFFKRINDEHGHDCGDKVLRQLGALLQRTLRYEDLCFRVGGEEFLILLNGLSPDVAIGVAERLRREVAQSTLHEHGRVTISIGVAGHIKAESADTWTKRCDVRLYAAKNQGRNRVVAHLPTTMSDVVPLINRARSAKKLSRDVLP